MTEQFRQSQEPPRVEKSSARPMPEKEVRDVRDRSIFQMEYLGQDLADLYNKHEAIHFDDQNWEVPEGPQNRKLVGEFFENITADPARLSGFLDVLLADKESRKRLVDGGLYDPKKREFLVDPENLPVHEAAFFAVRYREIWEEKREQMDEALPIWKRHFLARLLREIQTGRIPTTLEEAREKIENVEVIVYDNKAAVTFPPNINGVHFFRQQQVLVSVAAVGTKDLRPIIFHEWMHAISSQDPEGERSGLFDARRDETQYGWLNEAITEREAMRLTGDKDGAYVADRELYDLLRVSGKKKIFDQVFRDAYFERAQDDERPAWQELTAQFDEAYKKDFLRVVDIAVRERGVERVVDLVKRGKWQTLYQ